MQAILKCVVGKGYWSFRRDDSFDGVSLRRWRYWEPTAEHIEVIGLLSGILNTIPDAIASRGRPRFGEYILPKRGVPIKECFWKLNEAGKQEIDIVVNKNP